MNNNDRTRPHGIIKIPAGSTRAIGLECKYDRYLADVWAGGEYLNQELIENGHAVRVN